MDELLFFFDEDITPLIVPSDFDQINKDNSIEDPWPHNDAEFEDFDYQTLDIPTLPSGPAGIPPDDPWQVENDIEDFDYSAIEPGQVVANAAQLPGVVYSEEWYEDETEQQQFFGSRIQRNAIPQPPDDAWPHDDYTEEDWLWTNDENFAIGYPPAVLAFINHEADFTQDDYVEDFHADHFSNEDVGSIPEDAWNFDADWIEDEWWVDDTTRVSVNLLVYSDQQDWAFDEDAADEIVLDEYPLSTVGIFPYNIEDGWVWDEDVESQYLPGSRLTFDGLPPPVVALQYNDIGFEFLADYEVEDFFTNHYGAEEPPPIVEDPWPWDDYTDEDWIDDTNIGDGTRPYNIDDAWPHDDSVEDEWLDDTNIGASIFGYTNEDAWPHDDTVEDEQLDDTNIGANAPTLAYISEDPWPHDDSVEDEWLDDTNIGGNFVAPPDTAAFNEVGFEFLADYEVEDFFTNHYTAEETPFPPDDGWVWDDDTTDEWFVEDNIVDRPSVFEDAWSWDDFAEDDWYIDELIGATLLLTNTNSFEDWLYDEDVEDLFVVDEVQQPFVITPSVFEDAWAHDDEVEDDWQWWLDAQTIPEVLYTVTDDPTDWQETVDDDWQWWLDAQVGASIPPGAIQYFGDEASYLEEWLQIDDDCDWYNISNLVVDAAKSCICILQDNDTIVVLQDNDEIVIIGGN